MTFTSTLLSRDVLKLSGEETRPLLQGLLTANIDQLTEVKPLYTALLTPQGKIIETMFLMQLGEDLYLDVPAGRGDAFLKKLMLYRLRAKVTIERADLSVGVSPDIESIPEATLIHADDPRHPEMGTRWLKKETSGLSSAEEDYLIHQASLGISDLDAGFSEAETFPLDINLDALNGIDHQKGCFVGQEVASRMFRKGEIRKRTYIVSGDRLSAGLSLKQGERTVGEIRHVIGATGLALVRLDRLEGTAATADDQPVQLQKPDYLS